MVTRQLLMAHQCRTMQGSHCQQVSIYKLHRNIYFTKSDEVYMLMAKQQCTTITTTSIFVVCLTRLLAGVSNGKAKISQRGTNIRLNEAGNWYF